MKQKMYEKVYLISDVHGEIKGISDNLDEFTKETPLFILGDLFNKVIRQEKYLLETVVNLINDDRCHFILGNHDEVMFQLLFPDANYGRKEEEVIFNITHIGTTKVLNTLKRLISEKYGNMLLIQRDKLINNEVTLEQYYDCIKQYKGNDQELPIINMVQKLYKNCKLYCDISVKGMKFRLTHSGQKEICEGFESITYDYIQFDDIDATVMGHIVFEGATVIGKINNAIPKDIFYKINGYEKLEIQGNVLYNPVNNILMIDDGSYANLVIIA